MEQNTTASILDKNLEYLPKQKKTNSLQIISGILAIVLVAISGFLYIENTNLKKQLRISPKPLLPKSCDYDGVTYQPGDGFPSTDGCNSCSCSDDGEVACTLMACESNDLPPSDIQGFVPSENWISYTDPAGIFRFDHPDNMYIDSQNRNVAVRFENPENAANLTGMVLDVVDEAGYQSSLDAWLEKYLTSGSVVNQTVNRSLIQKTTLGGIEAHRIDPDSAPEDISRTVYVFLINGTGYEIILSHDIKTPQHKQILDQILSSFEVTE